jgi:hypothetical protein
MLGGYAFEAKVFELKFWSLCFYVINGAAYRWLHLIVWSFLYSM